MDFRRGLLFASAIALALGVSKTALAQSSGNIATSSLQTVCEMATTATNTSATYTCFDPSKPAGSNTVPCPTFSSGMPLLKAPIQVSAGSGNAIVITPSIDTGLYTNTTVSGTGTLTGSDGENTGVLVTVTVCNSAGQCQPASPEVASGNPPGATGVMYDERFQDLSISNLQCSVGAMCNVQVVLNTLSAHSFNFYYPVPAQDTYTVKVYATLANPSANTAACVGPATLTAIQVKAFSQN